MFPNKTGTDGWVNVSAGCSMRLAVGANFLWVLCVYASFFGWGQALARGLGLRRDAGTAGSLGIAIAIAIGGPIDLLRIMSPAVAYGFVITGAALAALQYLPALRAPHVPALPPDWITRLLLAAFLLLAAVAIAGYVYSASFHKTDDYPAYLVFPQKMLETGSLGFEPFSERRLATSVGGLYFLQALISAGSGVFFLHAIDPAFAVMLIVLLLEAAMRGHGVALRSRLMVLLLFLLLLPPVSNLTANLLPMALMLCICLLLEAGARRSIASAMALAMLGAAIVTLKSAYLPWVGSFFAFVYGARLIAGRFAWRAWREPAAVAALMLAVLSPWLAANLRDVGAILFPTFGRGFYAAQYGLFRPPWAAAPPGGYLTALTFEARKLGPAIVVASVLFGLVLASGQKRPRSLLIGPMMPAAGALAAALVLTAALGLGSGFVDEVPRYAWPGVIFALLVLVYRWVVGWPSVPAAAAWRRRGGNALVIAASLALLCDNAHGLYQYYGHALTNAGMAVLGPAFRPAMLPARVADEAGGARKAVARMQQAIPAGATVLERLDYPFLLDFNRNKILVADWPGEVSLPPGMPVFKDAERLAGYLLHASVRYVAYGYASEAEYPAAEFHFVLGRGEWLEAEARMALAFQKSLGELMQTRRILYKDNERVVIDLARLAPPRERPLVADLAAAQP